MRNNKITPRARENINTAKCTSFIFEISFKQKVSKRNVVYKEVGSGTRTNKALYHHSIFSDAAMLRTHEK